MNNDSRTTFLLRKQQLGLTLTDDERRELADTPEFVGERDAHGNFVAGVMVFPRRLTGTLDEQYRQFAAMMNVDGTPPTDEQVEAFVAGKPVGTPHDQPPVDEHDEWADDAPPVEPTPAPVEPPAVAPAAEPPPVPAPEAPVGNDAPALPPGHTYVRTLPTGEIEADYADPSYPRSPARRVILSPKKLRKLRNESARAASLMRRASSDGSRKVVRE